MVEEVDVTATERGRCTLRRIDYEDAFLLDIGSADHWTAEQWARAVLEGAPTKIRRGLRRAWTLLGLRLEPAASAIPAVLGWRIHRRTPEMVLLGADSRFGMSGQLLVMVDGQSLVFATFAQQTNPLLRAIWIKIIPRHVRIVSYLLHRARTESIGRCLRPSEQKPNRTRQPTMEEPDHQDRHGDRVWAS